MQIGAIQMNATVGTQAYTVALNALDVSLGGTAHSSWPPSDHMQFGGEAALKSYPVIADHLSDKPGANRIKMPLTSKAPPFISSNFQDGWRSSPRDMLPPYAVDQFMVPGSQESVCGPEPPLFVRECWNTYDKTGPPGDFSFPRNDARLPTYLQKQAGPPGDLSFPRKDARPPAHQQEEEQCLQCGVPFTADSVFCRNCGAKRHKEDATWGCQTERWCYDAYDPELLGMPPKAVFPPLSRDLSGEILFERALEDPPISRGRQSERQPHTHSCVSRTPSPPPICHLHPLIIDNTIKFPVMPLAQLRVQLPEEDLQQRVEEWPQERFVERPVKHTFIHYSTSSVEESGDEDTESSGGSTTNSERTLNRSSTAPSLIMQNPVFQIKSQDAEKKSNGLAKMQLLHAQKQCSPCAYFRHKADGCRLGDDCQFCHLCPASATEGKKKSKSRDVRLRLLRLRAMRNGNKGTKEKNSQPECGDVIREE